MPLWGTLTAPAAVMVPETVVSSLGCRPATSSLLSTALEHSGSAGKSIARSSSLSFVSEHAGSGEGVRSKAVPLMSIRPPVIFMLNGPGFATGCAPAPNSVTSSGPATIRAARRATTSGFLRAVRRIAPERVFMLICSLFASPVRILRSVRPPVSLLDRCVLRTTRGSHCCCILQIMRKRSQRVAQQRWTTRTITCPDSGGHAVVPTGEGRSDPTR